MTYGDDFIYVRINWENYPSDKTPVNEQNLNNMDLCLHMLDERVVWLNNNKFDKSESFKLVKNVDLDEETGIFTITYYDNTEKKFDTLLEKIATNWDYNEVSQQLIITLDDGTVKMVDLSALITQYEFMTSDTIFFEVQTDGKVKAIVREGSIQEKHLRPDYLADIKIEVEKAKESEVEAEKSSIGSKSWAVGGTGTRVGEDTNNSKYHSEQSRHYSEEAKRYLEDMQIGDGTITIKQDGISRGSFTLNQKSDKTIELDSSSSGAGDLTSWTAKTRGQTWSRICALTARNGYRGFHGILSISADRSNVSYSSVFLISAGVTYLTHITQIGGSFSNFKYRALSKTGNTVYIEIFDTAAGISSGANQQWNCSFLPLESTGIGVIAPYTEFTDGTTLPDGYSVRVERTAETGNSIVADRFFGALKGTAEKLETPRKIGNAAFDGSKDISVEGIGAVPDYSYDVDLSNTSVYDEDTYYPVVGNSLPNDGRFYRIEVCNALNSGYKPSWSNHSGGYSYTLKLDDINNGWGTSDRLTIVYGYSYRWCDEYPGGYSQMVNSGRPVLWLRGGGRYYVKTSTKMTLTVHTSSYTDAEQTVAPTTTNPGLSINRTQIYANLNGTALEATKLSTSAGSLTVPVYIQDGIPKPCELNLPKIRTLFTGEVSITGSESKNINIPESPVGFLFLRIKTSIGTVFISVYDEIRLSQNISQSIALEGGFSIISLNINGFDPYSSLNFRNAYRFTFDTNSGFNPQEAEVKIFDITGFKI